MQKRSPWAGLFRIRTFPHVSMSKLGAGRGHFMWPASFPSPRSLSEPPPSESRASPRLQSLKPVAVSSLTGRENRRGILSEVAHATVGLSHRCLLHAKLIKLRRLFFDILGHRKAFRRNPKNLNVGSAQRCFCSHFTQLAEARKCAS